MKKTIIIFVIIFTATTLIPLIAIARNNADTKSDGVSKEMVTIFNE